MNRLLVLVVVLVTGVLTYPLVLLMIWAAVHGPP